MCPSYWLVRLAKAQLLAIDYVLVHLHGCENDQWQQSISSFGKREKRAIFLSRCIILTILQDSSAIGRGRLVCQTVLFGFDGSV